MECTPRQSYDLLEDWLDQLRVAYVQKALEVASYEETHHLASDNDAYVQMDRIERDIERAERALQLFRLHHKQIAVPATAEKTANAA